MDELAAAVTALRRRRGRGASQEQLAEQRQQVLAQAEALSGVAGWEGERVCVQGRGVGRCWVVCNGNQGGSHLNSPSPISLPRWTEAQRSSAACALLLGMAHNVAEAYSPEVRGGRWGCGFDCGVRNRDVGRRHR